MPRDAPVTIAVLFIELLLFSERLLSRIRSWNQYAADLEINPMHSHNSDYAHYAFTPGRPQPAGCFHGARRRATRHSGSCAPSAQSARSQSGAAAPARHVS